MNYKHLIKLRDETSKNWLDNNNRTSFANVFPEWSKILNG